MREGERGQCVAWVSGANVAGSTPPPGPGSVCYSLSSVIVIVCLCLWCQKTTADESQSTKHKSQITILLFFCPLAGQI